MKKGRPKAARRARHGFIASLWRGRRLGDMRAPSSVSSLFVVLVLMSGCSPDEPNDVEVTPEQRAPRPADNLDELPNIAERIVEVPCAELARLEAFLVEARQRYTEQHPDIIRMRQAIARLRDTVPTDEVCANAVRAVEQPPRQ
jgi:hypothetical protein